MGHRATTQRHLVGSLVALLLSMAVATADDQAAELTQLRNRISLLEAENQQLRERLAQIAELVAAVNPDPSPTLNIRLASDQWGDAQQADILKVLKASAEPIWKSAGQPALHRINVVHDQQGPLVAYKRDPGNAYKVLLDVQGRLWAKFSYQFSHEMCHILANYRDAPNQQKWLEESICECASLYSLRSMGKSWQHSPPYQNWSSYAAALTEYADNRIREAQVLPPDNLANWYAQHKSTLDTTSTNRDLNLVVAVRLLKIFEQHPGSWRVVRSLNTGDPRENDSLERYLDGWHARVAAADQAVVQEIADLFGLKLKPR